MRLPVGLSVLLGVLLLAFLIGDAVQDSRSRKLTDDAIETANKWKATAERWEEIAKRYEEIAQRCVEPRERQ